MAVEPELSPELQVSKQKLEAVCARWGIPYDDVLAYSAGEIAYELGGQDPVDEAVALENLQLVPRVLQPSPDTPRAVADRKAYCAGVPAAAEKLILPHVEAPGSRITTLDYDPDTHEGQRPMRFHIDGNRQPRKVTDGVANLVEPRWPGLIEKIKGDKASMNAIKSAIDLLEDGKSVWAITFHAEDIIDTIFAQKLAFDLFDEQGYDPEMTMISVSKIIAWGQYDVPQMGKAPMMPIVQLAADRVHLPWPKTKSSEDILADLPEREITRHNKRIAIDTNDLLTAGVFGTLSPRARTRNESDDPNVFRGSGVNEGTAGFMVHPNVYVMRVSLWRMGKELVARCMEPVKLEETDEVPPFMEEFAYDLTELVGDKTFILDPGQEEA